MVGFVSLVVLVGLVGWLRVHRGIVEVGLDVGLDIRLGLDGGLVLDVGLALYGGLGLCDRCLGLDGMNTQLHGLFCS